MAFYFLLIFGVVAFTEEGIADYLKAPSEGEVPELSDVLLCEHHFVRPRPDIVSEVEKRHLNCRAILEATKHIELERRSATQRLEEEDRLERAAEQERQARAAEQDRLDRAERRRLAEERRLKQERKRYVDEQVRRLAAEEEKRQALYEHQLRLHQEQLEAMRREREFQEGMSLLNLGLGIMEHGFSGPPPPPVAPPGLTDLSCVRNCLNNYGGEASNSYVQMCERNCTR